MIRDIARALANTAKYMYHVGIRNRKVAQCVACHWMGTRNVILCPACGHEDIIEPPHTDDFDGDEIPWDELNNRFEVKEDSNL